MILVIIYKKEGNSMDGFISINKPEGMTSFDVVSKVRKLLHAKVGHSGTLDPMATGVLIIAINKATKAINYIGVEDKVYECTCQLGLKTDTGDVTGSTIEKMAIPQVNEQDILSVFNKMVGKTRQRVPMYSAKKVDGKKLYEYARKNIEVEQQYTDIEIFKLELLHFDSQTIHFRAHVSNGTYIRTLCEDLSFALGTVGTMASLNRIQVGPFKIENSYNLDELSQEIELMPTKDAISLPKIVSDEFEDAVKNGKRIELENKENLVLVDAGTYFAVYEREIGTTYRVQRGLW